MRAGLPIWISSVALAVSFAALTVALSTSARLETVRKTAYSKALTKAIFEKKGLSLRGSAFGCSMDVTDSFDIFSKIAAAKPGDVIDAPLGVCLIDP